MGISQVGVGGFKVSEPTPHLTHLTATVQLRLVRLIKEARLLERKSLTTWKYAFLLFFSLNFLEDLYD